MNVETMLKRKGAVVFTVAPDRPVSDAVHLMKEKGIGALVVSEDGVRLSGIISERDIVHRMADQGATLLDQTVRSIMTGDVKTCAPADSAREVLSLMTEKRIRHLPVLRDGRLSGMISIGDAVKLRLDEATAEAEALKEYIARG